MRNIIKYKFSINLGANTTRTKKTTRDLNHISINSYKLDIVLMGGKKEKEEEEDSIIDLSYSMSMKRRMKRERKKQTDINCHLLILSLTKIERMFEFSLCAYQQNLSDFLLPHPFPKFHFSFSHLVSAVFNLLFFFHLNILSTF